MNDVARRKLSEIIARHGRSLVDEPRRCEGLLRDYCGAYRREIAAIVTALEERVGVDLLATNTGMPREVLLNRLAQRLHDNSAIDNSAAKWAVNSLALALGVVSNTELEALEQAQLTQSTRATVALPHPTVPETKARSVTTASTSSVIVVSAEGGGDYASITEALNAAAMGARLLVRRGVYRESVVINKQIEIIGEGARQDIIIESADASCVLMRTNEALVRGLTLHELAGMDKTNAGFFAVDIPQGRLTLEECDITSASLSCIGVHNELTDPIIRRCSIHAGSDSGVYIFNAAGGTVEECDIYDNRNVGVAVTERAKPDIRRCRIHDGKHAGIVFWNGGAGSVEECEIFGNAKADVGINDEGNPVFRHCRIYGGNDLGVFVHDNGRGTLENCDIYGHAEPEVAITGGGNLVVRGCKIYDGRQSGVFIRDEGKALVERCDIYRNADAGVSVYDGGVAAIRQCRINGNGMVAIRVKVGGAADVENSDLTGNRIAAWETDYGALVERRGNTF